MFEIANPIGLIAFASVPAIVFLHFFRTRFKRLIVSAVFLWERERQKSPEGARFTRLQNTASLILEICAAVLLSVLISGVSCSRNMHYSHRVVILDDSLSMKAGENGEYFYQKAVSRLKEITQEHERAIYTVIKASRHPKIIAGPFGQPGEILLKVKDWVPGSFASNMTGALEFSTQFRESVQEVIYITDHVPGEYPDHVRLVSIGSPIPNTGIVTAKRMRSISDGETVFIVIENFSKKSIPNRIMLFAAGQKIGEKNFTVKPGEKQRLNFQLTGVSGAVAVKLEKDGFAEDDSVMLLPEPRKTVRIYNAFTDADLGIERLTGIVADVKSVNKTQESNCAFLKAASGVKPAENRWVVEIGTGAENDTAISEGFLIDRKNPILRGITLGGTIWGGAEEITGNVVPLISAGSHILMYKKEFENFYRMNISPERTNFFKGIDWPILFANIVEQVRASLPGLSRANYILGEEIIYHAPVLIRGETGSLYRDGMKIKDMVFSNVNVLRGTDRKGMYTLKLKEDTAAQLCVNFINSRESDFSSAREADIKGKGRTREITIQRIPPWFNPLLLVAAMLCLMGDWYILKKM